MMIEYDLIEDVSPNFAKWDSLFLWVSKTIELEGFVTGNLNFVFMSDDNLLSYNRKFLNHDYYTDVITFDNCDYPVINGDILISIDRILDNSSSLKVNYFDEFCRVVIHGVLHLCGYKDKTDTDELLMRQMEEKYLNLRSFT